MKLRVLLLISIIIIFTSNLYATHIVGGEFELRHLVNYNYRLSLNLYFDEINGDPGAQDNSIVVNFFDKGTNKLIMSQQMFLKSKTPVNYTNIDCTVGNLKTSKLVYSETIFLDPNVFNNQQGYYVTWERCCRNRTINNIVKPQDAAQTYYMEFPPVVKNGAAFQNSSPILFPPLSDYACVNELFYYEFNGADPDGDSIVYDMVTPLNGFTSTSMPFYGLQGYEHVLPKPAPYPTVNWQSGFSTNVQVKGNPPISIDSKSGQLIMRPSSKGLFVFGVRAQEFRNGKKIGEVRRDFQVLVLDCPKNETPNVAAREQSKMEFYKKGEVLKINPTGNRCIDVFFSDPDRAEFVSLRARPVNFSRQDFNLTGVTSGMINMGIATDSLKATLCFEDCFDTEGKIYQLDLIVKDDGCSLPRQDTVRLKFIVEPIPNAPPTVDLSIKQRVFNVKNGDVLSFDALGFDADNDNVTITAKGQNFDLNGQSITFTTKTGIGQVSSPFKWTIDCNALQQDSYKIDFEVSTRVCDKTVSRIETIEIRPENKNNIPVISTDKPDRIFNLVAGETFDAKVFGADIDLNTLTLVAAGNGFNLKDLGMNFTSSGGPGAAEGIFSWTAICSPQQSNVYQVTFSLKETACNPSPDQTMVFEFRVNSPNSPPTLTTDKTTLIFNLKLNEPFEANLFGNDIDLNNLTLTAVGEDFRLEDVGMIFNSQGGKGTANGKLTWIANCLGAKQGILRVKFNLKEDACSPAPDKQLTMEFRIVAPSLADYTPANIFTPNGDGLNDYFEIPELPSDFCTAQFASIKIFNRWGKQVYTSNNHLFKWDGKGVNDGVYFYVIDFGASTYKGAVTLVR